MSDFNSIKVHELPAFVKALKANGLITPDSMLDTLTLIDDLLTISRSKSLLSRKRGLSKSLDDRLDLEVSKVKF